jgi:hypothetical protein
MMKKSAGGVQPPLANDSPAKGGDMQQEEQPNEENIQDFM